MARPVKEGLDYFPHDTDAVNDEKIEALRALYGNNGYAFYFILLERIYRTNDAELDVSDAETIQILSRKVAVTTEEFMQMLETALKWKCFCRESYEKYGVLTSKGIKKRTSVVVEKRVTMREKYYKQKTEVSDAETREETEQKPDKEKKRKEKKRKEKDKRIYAPAVSMTEEEHQKLVDKHGAKDTARMIDILSNYKAAKGKQYKSDYHAILNWVVERLAEEKTKKQPFVKPSEPIRGNIEYKPEHIPTEEELARGREIARKLAQGIGRGMEP
jgi:hypothetical protein